MGSYDVQKKPELIRFGMFLLLLLLGLVFGCQAKEPPLSPAAAAFKKEIKECFGRLVQPLIEPVLKKDIAAIKTCLENTEPEALKLCRMCPFRMGVLDKKGNNLAVHPPKKDGGMEFHSYEVVQQALKSRKITHQRLYLQDGSGLYVICAPLLKGEQTIGILAIAMSAAEAKSRWGLTEEEFLSLDFNK